MIWVKTEAGKAELKSHGLIQQATTQNVLRAIDGVKSQELLLKYLPGVTPEDFRLLFRLQLIEPTGPRLASEVVAAKPAIARPQSQTGTRQDSAALARVGKLAVVLSRLVSTHLGLAGMALTSSIGRAATVVKCSNSVTTLSRPLIGRGFQDYYEFSSSNLATGLQIVVMLQLAVKRALLSSSSMSRRLGAATPALLTPVRFHSCDMRPSEASESPAPSAAID